jgi:hypothetical protein
MKETSNRHADQLVASHFLLSIKHAFNMRNGEKILAAGIAGTSAMTAFSYIISEKENKQFREPELLAGLLKKGIPGTPTTFAKMAGWLIHYAVGVGFTAVYNQLWKNKNDNSPSLANGLLVGGISGVAGAAVWKTSFKVHPNPPTTSFKKYYIHLVAAHLVFGATTALMYRMMRR